MEKHELKQDTLSQLHYGTIFKSEDGRIVVMGETDVVAFKDHAGWQVAEGLNFHALEEVTDDEVMGLLVTRKMFAEVYDGDTLYVGPMAPAQAFIVRQFPDWSCKPEAGRFRVQWNGGQTFGVADTPELAWRYAIAVDLGPSEDEVFNEFRI